MPSSLGSLGRILLVGLSQAYVTDLLSESDLVTGSDFILTGRVQEIVNEGADFELELELFYRLKPTPADYTEQPNKPRITIAYDTNQQVEPELGQIIKAYVVVVGESEYEVLGGNGIVSFDDSNPNPTPNDVANVVDHNFEPAGEYSVPAAAGYSAPAAAGYSAPECMPDEERVTSAGDDCNKCLAFCSNGRFTKPECTTVECHRTEPRVLKDHRGNSVLIHKTVSATDVSDCTYLVGGCVGVAPAVPVAVLPHSHHMPFGVLAPVDHVIKPEMAGEKTHTHTKGSYEVDDIEYID